MKWALVNTSGEVVNVIAYDGAEYTPPNGLALEQIEDHLEIGDNVHG